jgi:hypothetical protein
VHDIYCITGKNTYPLSFLKILGVYPQTPEQSKLNTLKPQKISDIACLWISGVAVFFVVLQGVVFGRCYFRTAFHSVSHGVSRCFARCFARCFFARGFTKFFHEVSRGFPIRIYTNAVKALLGEFGSVYAQSVFRTIFHISL